MTDIIRDAAFSRIVRYVTRGKYFQYPEQKADFDAHSYFSSKPSSVLLEKDDETPSEPRYQEE